MPGPYPSSVWSASGPPDVRVVADVLTPAALEAVEEFRAVPAYQRWNTTDAIGGCWQASRDFARILDRRGIPYEFQQYRGLPGWRTQFQHVIAVDGMVVDWIARQWRSDCDWPDVRPLTALEAEFGQPTGAICPRCGHRPDRCPPCRGPGPDPRYEVVGQVKALARLLAADVT